MQSMTRTGAIAPKLYIVSQKEETKMAKNGMKIEISKLMDGAWLAHAGVKGTPVPANALIDAGNVNLAILAMIDSGEFELRVKPVVTLVNYPQGSKNYFPVVKFVAPAGTKIGNVAIAKTEKVFELEHFRVGNKEARPSALREEEIVKGALTALNEKLFPPSDLTDRPIPQTDWSAKLSHDFHIAPDKMIEIARMIRETPGMTWQSMYIAYANAKK